MTTKTKVAKTNNGENLKEVAMIAIKNWLTTSPSESNLNRVVKTIDSFKLQNLRSERNRLNYLYNNLEVSLRHLNPSLIDIIKGIESERDSLKMQMDAISAKLPERKVSVKK